MSAAPLERAIAEYRAAHPEDDDLPDELLADLSAVRFRVFGLALGDLGRTIVEAFESGLRHRGFLPMPADDNPFPRLRLFRWRK